MATKPGSTLTAIAALGALVLLVPTCAEEGAGEASGPASSRRFEEIARFASPAARQAVAVDADHLYVISNHAIEKRHKRSGALVAAWEGPENAPIVYLNSGIVLDGKLYCAHSNYPGVPMLSSIEVFDSATLTHIASHSFGVSPGSATWIDRRDGHWWVAFAHYAGRGGEPGKGPGWTSLRKFGAAWRQVGGYAFPPEVIERFAPRSNSGGAWGADGRLYVTGHDAAEIYALRLPEAGPLLELDEILPAPIAGQGIAWDPNEPGVLYGILKQRREVVGMRLAR